MPAGAPSPFDRHEDTESNPAHRSFTFVFSAVATTVFETYVPAASRATLASVHSVVWTSVNLTVAVFYAAWAPMIFLALRRARDELIDEPRVEARGDDDDAPRARVESLGVAGGACHGRESIRVSR